MSDYSSDNVYPTSSKYFSASVAKSSRQKTERSEVVDQLPLLKDVMKRLDERIAFYGDVDAITIDLNTTPEAHIRQVAVNKLMKETLTAEKGWLETKLTKLSK